MALRNADRVKETTTTTLTGTYSLDGAAAGFQTFVAGVGSGNYCHYCVENGTDWEVGIGLVTDAAPDTLARTVVFQSSNADAAVSWPAGTKNVFCVATPAHNAGAGMRVMPIVRRLSADHSISSATNTEVTGLEIQNLQPGTYVAQYFLILQTAGTTVGFRFSVNFTGTAVRQVITSRQVTSGAAAATGVIDDNAVTLTGQLVEGGAINLLGTTTNSLVTTGASAANADLMMEIVVIIEVSAAGNLELWHGSESATATVVESGSSVIVTQTD